MLSKELAGKDQKVISSSSSLSDKKEKVSGEIFGKGKPAGQPAFDTVEEETGNIDQTVAQSVVPGQQDFDSANRVEGDDEHPSGTLDTGARSSLPQIAGHEQPAVQSSLQNEGQDGTGVKELEKNVKLIEKEVKITKSWMPFQYSVSNLRHYKRLFLPIWSVHLLQSVGSFIPWLVMIKFENLKTIV